jgi:small multidrug resistance family-3 protein
MQNWLWFIGAAFCEIAGCYAFWAWLRLEKSPLWLVPGTLSLMVFAYVLTRVEADFAGRTFAAYGGVYIVSSLVWLFIVEDTRPHQWDILGALFCIVGAGIILFAGRI